MKLCRIIVIFSIFVVMFIGNIDAKFFKKFRNGAKKFGKGLERIGQHTRDAAVQGLSVAQQAVKVGTSIQPQQSKRN